MDTTGMVVENGKITGASLGFDDDGVLMVIVRVTVGIWTGGVCFRGLVNGDRLLTVVRAVMQVGDVTMWEHLIGHYVRVCRKAELDAVAGIGHIVDEIWLAVGDDAPADEAEGETAPADEPEAEAVETAAAGS